MNMKKMKKVIFKCKMKDYYFNCKDLAKYINKKHKEKFNQNITPIKLQKALYFLFAYWGGYIESGRQNSNFVEEDMTKYKKYLHNGTFQAWTY